MFRFGVSSQSAGELSIDVLLDALEEVDALELAVSDACSRMF